MGVKGSKLDEESENEHGSRATGRETDSEAVSYLSSDERRRNERQTATATRPDLRHNSHNTAADSELILQARFEQLHQGGSKGKDKLLCTEVFDREPYVENHFCQHLVKHLFSTKGREGNGDITYQDFHDELTRWQTSSEADKIKLMFSVLPLDPTGTSQIALWSTLLNCLPSCYSESESKLLAQAAINTMISDTASFSVGQYKRWITRNIPRERLRDTLEFNISNLN